MKKSAALFFLCLTFTRCVFADTAITNDNLIVAFQFLDDQWIQDTQAYTGEYARVYRNSLNVNTPPSYGVYTLNDNGMPVYSSVSQIQMWDYLSTNSSTFVSYIMDDGDGLGEYVRVSSLANLGSFFISYVTNNVSMAPLDFAIVSNARRLSTLSVAQSPAEISAISNATCNCDWTIVTNIYTTVQLIRNENKSAFETLNEHQEDIYKWLTGVDPVGGTIGYFTFTDFLDTVFNSVSNIHTFSEFELNLISNVVIQFYATKSSYISALNSIGLLTDIYGASGNLQSLIDAQKQYVFDAAYETPHTFSSPSSTIRNILVPLWMSAQGATYASYFTAEQLDWMLNTLWPVQTNQSNIATALFTGDIQDKYSYLTNLYSDLADGNHNMPYTERLELLLAALVFSGDGQADTNQTSFSDAETNAEDVKTQYVSLINQLNQTILGDVKSNIERTDRSLLSFFQTLNSALQFQYTPNIHIEHNIDSNFGTNSLPDGFGVGDYWEFDLVSNGVDTFINFCRACSSIIILSGWLFVVWHLGRGTAKICWRMAVLAFKTCSKLLG